MNVETFTIVSDSVKCYVFSYAKLLLLGVFLRSRFHAFQEPVFLEIKACFDQVYPFLSKSTSLMKYLTLLVVRRRNRFHIYIHVFSELTSENGQLQVGLIAQWVGKNFSF